MKEYKELKLDTIEFTTIPTEDEIAAMAESMRVFMTRLSGALLVSDKYSVGDENQKMAAVLGCCVQLRGLTAAFRGQANIVVPQPSLVPGRR